MQRHRPISWLSVLTLGLGIAAVSAVYTLVQPLLLDPLPFPDAARLVRLEARDAKGRPNPLSYPELQDVAAHREWFDDSGAFDIGFFSLTGVEEPEQVPGAIVLPSLWRTLKIQPMLGRLFSETDHRAVLLSHSAWKRRFGGDSNVLGRWIQLDWARSKEVEQYRVIGVMPPGFWLYYGAVEAFVQAEPDAAIKMDHGARQWYTVARLRDGVSIDQVRAGLTTLPRKPDWQFSAALWKDEVTAPVRTYLQLSLAAVAGLLIIACVNAGGLLLAKGLTRQRDTAVRIALGASSAQLLRDSIREAAWIAGLGAVVGLLAGSALLKVLVAWMPTEIYDLRFLPNAGKIAVDGHTIALAAALAFLACVLFGCLPLWQARRIDVVDGLKQGSTHGTASRHTLLARQGMVAVEVALLVPLLFGSGLLLRTLQRLCDLPLGFQQDNVLVLRVPGPEGTGREGTRAYHAELVRRIRALPGVLEAAITSQQPMTRTHRVKRVELPGLSELQRVDDQVVMPEYFTALGIRLREGRVFTPSDGAAAIVVNEAFARRFFGGKAEGRALRIEGQSSPVTIAGVVENARDALTADPSPRMYRNWHAAPEAGQLAVRTEGASGNLMKPVVAEVRTLGGVPAEVSVLSTFVDNEMWRQKLSSYFLAMLSVVAFVLCLVGVFGVVTHMMARNRREMGIRLALGALPRDVQRLTLVRGMAAPFAGALAGVALALALGRWVAFLLFGVSGQDAAILFWAFAGALASALLACLLQIGALSRIHPAEALRHE